MADFFYVPLILFVIVVVPIWIVAHYSMRWKATRSLSQEEERMIAELWDSSERMQTRIKTLEAILDAESPDWRDRV